MNSNTFLPGKVLYFSVENRNFGFAETVQFPERKINK
ncbi:hypothetical protein SAMN05192585_10512 [Acetanaerobacterium elongatum]|uniref:Uncharacterized protein n=1 Tax=Acetanaerobacterium elongatum TaxID=258515 RepID=A0A1G9W137_9FIRM|nr:hypothetical protein SAMN05192585_10512 [Acetanaerobacterium elongatum]